MFKDFGEHVLEVSRRLKEASPSGRRRAGLDVVLSLLEEEEAAQVELASEGQPAASLRAHPRATAAHSIREARSNAAAFQKAVWGQLRGAGAGSS